MNVGFPGLGTVINVATVVIGALLGMWVGHRIPERTRSVVTDCLGLTTLLVAGLSAVSVTDSALREAVGPGVPVLVVLGSLLIGSRSGSRAWPASCTSGPSDGGPATVPGLPTPRRRMPPAHGLSKAG